MTYEEVKQACAESYMPVRVRHIPTKAIGYIKEIGSPANGLILVASAEDLKKHGFLQAPTTGYHPADLELV